MASVMAVCVGAMRAGQELCVTRRPATHCAARMECARRASVSVTRDGQGSTAISRVVQVSATTMADALWKPAAGTASANQDGEGLGVT
ncbi:hypothetical protein E3U43_009257 [Larimichthys crocea]|uniref:Uncharacterized protein n=1 Tax=Larimichthys crocea TaxID=215358 RepID=A0ACD3RWU6_LARCR|nr:hypothetical protein E3U43_009257 [Larimichthys crocea]